MILRPAGKPRLGQQVYVRRRFRRPPYTEYFERGRVEILRRGEVVVRVYGYELTVAYADLFEPDRQAGTHRPSRIQP